MLPNAPSRLIKLSTLLSLLFLLALPVAAQNKDDKISLSNLGWSDESHIERQTEKIDELARSNFGLQLHGNKDDLNLLQRIIHRGLIKRDDTLNQQALGAVMGNLLVEEFGLEWKIYKDKQGRSRATCIPNTEQCLFPMTAFSRRMAVGIMPNVDRIYRDMVVMITPYLPKSPYDVQDK